MNVRTIAAALALALAFMLPNLAEAAPWLFVSDIHLDPLSAISSEAPLGADTNEALLDSALAEMKRVDPAPPVVVIPGDFLGHKFDYKNAKATVTHLARAFDEAFPRAQFVIALGNEDSGCGDYVIAPNAPFLREAAAAWGPLVNRHGEAPDFMKTFPRDGFYTAKLPVPGLRAVVIDDVFWSPRFRAGCGSTEIDGGKAALEELDRALPPGNPDRTWVLLHIPPGIDTFSTIQFAHRLAVVPFLNTAPRLRLLEILGDRRRNVTLAISGHTHKFSFRLIDAETPDPLPILLVPSLSPVFRNSPMFLTAEVTREGTIREIEEHAYLDGGWRAIGGTSDLGLPDFTGRALAALDRRLERDPDLRALYARLYGGGAASEISPKNAGGYLCAIDSLSATDYRRCTGQRGFRFITGRGLLVVAIVAIGAFLIGVLGVLTFRRSAYRSP
jgi:hypothetical protein